MIFELLCVMLILIGGCAMISVTGINGWVLPILGFAAGIALQVTIGTIQAITSLPTSPLLTVGLTFTLPVIWWVWHYLRCRYIPIKPISAFFTFALIILTAIIMRKIVNVTPDSFEYIAIGSLLNSGNFHEVSPALLLTRLLAVPILHAPANIIGEFYFRSISPLLALTTLVCLFWLIHEGLKPSLVNPRLLKLSSIIAVFLLATNNRFIFNAFYINGHMLNALFLLLLVGCGWLMVHNTNLPPRSLMMLQVVSIPVLTVTRPEASIFAFIALLPILLTGRIPWKHRVILLAFLGLSIIVWHGFIWMKFIAAGEYIPTSVFGMLCIGLLAIFASPFLVWNKLNKYFLFIIAIAELSLWLVLISFFFRNPNLFKHSVLGTIENVLFDAGGWGISLIFIGFILITVLAFTKVEDRVFLRFPLTTFVPFTFLLAYLRGGAYRAGYGDSLNRMFLHLLPLAILLIVSSLTSERWNLPQKIKKLITYLY